MKTFKALQVKRFNPYDAAVLLGGKTRSGINWTWVTFPDETTRQQFDNACKANGYRVRNYGLCETQFHHYVD